MGLTLPGVGGCMLTASGTNNFDEVVGGSSGTVESESIGGINEGSSILFCCQNKSLFNFFKY